MKVDSLRSFYRFVMGVCAFMVLWTVVFAVLDGRYWLLVLVVPLLGAMALYRREWHRFCARFR